jgi:hypothetical protein
LLDSSINTRDSIAHRRIALTANPEDGDPFYLFERQYRGVNRPLDRIIFELCSADQGTTGTFALTVAVKLAFASSS